jgi:selenoprotein W-related protein
MSEFNPSSNRPRIEIHYCTKCKWLLRAAWLAQELLSTFESEIGEVALIPAESGVFVIVTAGETVWDRKIDDGFPTAKVLKQRVRNQIAPAKDLGHSDVRPESGDKREPDVKPESGDKPASDF